ncbi:hypothetical protein ACUIJQ_08420 [Levilactobacillus hammesii]|uniref:Uncharacterized protein n=1 Tax=Levilactobacillus hammesii DSM 16381 TaxID=1423753 RepID=A0A0R1UQQ8_9LACO|nr:hypothetical protein [Levilactobacillus hammesii]KRL95537.1 hypothetical protein FD28_GL002506 [Levilactobacillus hammesii DSM 16381]
MKTTLVKKSITILIVIGGLSAPSIASASSIYSSNNSFWRKSRWVTFTKNVHVSKIKITHPSYKSYAVDSFTLKRGAHYKIDHFGSDYAWGLNSGRYTPTPKYSYIINNSGHKWFVFGKKTLDPHKLKKQSKNGYENMYVTSTRKGILYFGSPYSKKKQAVKPNTKLNLLSYGTTNNGREWYRVKTEYNKTGWVSKRSFTLARVTNHLTASLNANSTFLIGNTVPNANVSTPEQPEIKYVRADIKGNYKLPLLTSIGYYNTDSTLYVVSSAWGYQDASTEVDFVGHSY